jgi:D-amino-acid oxidase
MLFVGKMPPAPAPPLPPPPIQVTVLGAGVVGLTTALLLQSSKGGYAVTVEAMHTPSHASPQRHPWYASSEAGAHWFSVANDDDTRQQQYDLTTYRTWLKMYTENREAAREAGLTMMPFRVVFERVPADRPRPLPWYAQYVKDFRTLDGGDDAAELARQGFVWGWEFQTFTVNVHKYLRWLVAQFQAKGGRLVERRHSVKHIDEVLLTRPNAPTVLVKCTGYGARYLGGVRDLDASSAWKLIPPTLSPATMAPHCWATR